ncbi:MFS transporter [Chondrinema litorale]|uniref:MFS transporter n=1 Tax=Chondrinema litorale TaxID=2994555 RepID=UPI002542DB0A|nr:MFS transporter [Chondrinema litorale]UZR95703.1 MFS transporter [Chondrinema litorale]
MKKPRLSFWQIWNMNFGFMGIQFGFALQNANVSRIFETLGANKEEIPILWLAAPVTGLLIQPVIGYFSDRTWHSKLGRRRPYFLIGAILSSLALIAMPNSSTLWMAAGALWIMDASINISMEPFRAFVGDMLPDRQRTSGFAVQTFFIGAGSVVASALPFILTNWFGVSNTAPEGEIPPSVVWSFYLGAFAFISCIIWTVTHSFEYSPKEMKEFSQEGFEEESHGINEFFSSFVKMPKTMIQLAFVQYFSWFALFCMWIYTTSAVTQHIFGTEDTTSKLYNDGADLVGLSFAAYNLFSAFLAFLLPYLAKKTSRKLVHIICLFTGAAGLASISFINSPENANLIYLSMVGIGLAWSSILTMPYAMLSGALPANKMGIYMGIFNFFIVIPQITAASILGYLMVNYFDNQAINVIMLGAVSFVISALLTFFVNDKSE